MPRRLKIALIVAVLFLLVNLGGAVFALVRWELPHAGIHVALAILSALAVGQIAARRVAR